MYLSLNYNIKLEPYLIMDQFKAVASSGGACAQAIGCICSCGCLAMFITFIVYLGKYSFDNPNLPAWYVESGATSTLVGTAPAATVDAATVTDVHANFVMWFTWMFANQITLIASPILGGLFMWISTKSGMLGTCLNTLLSCGITCSGLVAWIMGMVWRFSAAGQFASGDALAEDATPGLLVQSESGNFMGIYYLITWILIGTSCGCALIGGVVSCLCK